MFEGQNFREFCSFAWTVNVFYEFQSDLALVDVVLMQTQKFFCQYSHGDLPTKVLSLGSFVLYSNVATP